MSDLVEFLRARLDEDEVAAREATEGPWIAEYSGEIGQCVIPADAKSTREYVARTQLYAAAYDAQHVARWDPARVLAELAAKRAIIEEHPVGARECATCWAATAVEGPCPTVRALARIYVEHPDFRVEWRLG